MLLAIDSGNTNIVFALFEGETIRVQWRSSNDPHRTADEYAVWLTQLMALEGIAPATVSDAIVANVVPLATHNLKTLCRRYFQCEPLVVGEAGVDLGLDIRIDDPEEVGADRLVNAVAAHATYAGPVIVVDFGTATTCDIVDSDGNYCGGVIAPGINLSLQALPMAAARRPRVPVQRPDRVTGNWTVAAMRSGIFWGYVGMIEGLVARIRDEFGADMTVVATGGLAAMFTEASDVIERHDADLTLRGLMLVHRRNRAP